MKKSLASINSNLPRADWLRRNYILNDFTGIVPKGATHLASAYADYDENGVCTGIRLYSVGQGKEARHYYETGRTINITGIIELFYKGEMERERACELIEDEIKHAE